MLLNLYIKNFAIIEEINIDFEKGLNILSGETGSGKSLVLKAIGLLKGERFNKDYIGSFSNNTIVEATFSSNEILNNLLQANEYDIDENLILTRQFSDTSSITKVNNRACNIKFLATLSKYLFDIHGQHSSLEILDKSNYIDIIDKFDAKTIEHKNLLSTNLAKVKNLVEENSKLDLTPEEVEREKDLLKFQIKEINSFDFSNYDEERLNKEYKKLSNQKELIDGTNQIIDIISQSNKNITLKELAHSVYEKLDDYSKYDEELTTLTSDALNIRELINDLSSSIENYSYSLEIDEERVQIIEDLFSSFQVLKIKYGRDTEEILSYLSNIEARYEIISNIESKRNSIQKEISKIEIENKEIATKLSNIRKNIITKLEKDIVVELNEMNMNYIDFEIYIEKKDEITKDGFDKIDFLISTNKGQELKSLSQVSSGGETSRFMLALKSVLSENEEIDTLIFDEIDTGISGKTADIVGNKLKKISKNLQLIVISHLAQIAAKSDSHYLISKNIINDKTRTSVNKLDKDEKVYEIARLISASDITDKSLSTAKELVEENKNYD